MYNEAKIQHAITYPYTIQPEISHNKRPKSSSVSIQNTLSDNGRKIKINLTSSQDMNAIETSTVVRYSTITGLRSKLSNRVMLELSQSYTIQ